MMGSSNVANGDDMNGDKSFVVIAPNERTAKKWIKAQGLYLSDAIIITSWRQRPKLRGTKGHPSRFFFLGWSPWITGLEIEDLYRELAIAGWKTERRGAK